MMLCRTIPRQRVVTTSPAHFNCARLRLKSSPQDLPELTPWPLIHSAPLITLSL